MQTQRATILVEGISDRLALEVLAERRGRSLAAEGVAIVPMGGAQAIGRFVDRLGPDGLDVKLAGLYDVAEEGHFQRALERAGLGSNLTRSDLERLGFFACIDDLEDELIRALGPAAMEEVIEAHGELASLRALQRQPAWRGRPASAQLHRFLTSQSRRRTLVGSLVRALDLDDIPRPLDRVLAAI
jgi:hypothetical protein